MRGANLKLQDQAGLSSRVSGSLAHHKIRVETKICMNQEQDKAFSVNAVNMWKPQPEGVALLDYAMERILNEHL